MREVRKSWNKRIVSAVMAVILMVIPVITIDLTGITARAGEVVLEERYGIDLLDQEPFDFFGGSNRYGMRAYFADGKPVFSLEPGKLIYDKLSGYTAAYQKGEPLPVEMTWEQAELLYCAMVVSGATEKYGKDISPGCYAMAQATAWAVMSGGWTTVDNFKEQMEELGTHLVREEWRQAFSQCLIKYCDQIEEMCGTDSIPFFASGYEIESPVHKMTAGEDGVYTITFDTNGNWQQNSLCYDMPEGWDYSYNGNQITFTCRNGKPDSGMITGYFPESLDRAEGWYRPEAVSFIKPSGEGWQLSQTMLCAAEEKKPWEVYLRFAGGEECESGAYRMEYHRYVHDELLRTDYTIGIDKYCSETGMPLADTAFSVLEGFDTGQLEGTGLDASQFMDSEEMQPCGLPVYTDVQGRALHHDRKTYQYRKAYCGGHPRPQVMRLTPGENALPEEIERIDRWNEAAESDAASAWQECVEWCEKNCDFHGIGEEDARVKMEEDRQKTYDDLLKLKRKYTVKEQIARSGYILYGNHKDDKPVEVIEVLPTQKSGEEKQAFAISGAQIPLALKATPSNARHALEKATPSGGRKGGSSKEIPLMRVPWRWGGVVEKSRITPLEQKNVINGPPETIFAVEGHRTEGELHISKRDKDIYDAVRPISFKQSEDNVGYGMSQGDATLEGAVYGLYADEDILHPDGITGIVFSRGDLVSVAATDQNGDASFLCITEMSPTSRAADNLLEENRKNNGNQWIGAPLLLGSYYVKEITRSEGYELSQGNKDHPESNRGSEGYVSKKKGTVRAELLPRSQNGWDGSWEEVRVSYFNTDQVEIKVSGLPRYSDFLVMRDEDHLKKNRRLVSLDLKEQYDESGQPVIKKAKGGEIKLDESGRIIYKADEKGDPVYTDKPELEGIIASTYIQPYLSEQEVVTASASDSSDVRPNRREYTAAQREVKESTAALAEVLLSKAGYKECTEEYPWELLSLEGRTEKEQVDEIVSWCRDNPVWDSFQVAAVFEEDGKSYAAVRYGYSVLMDKGAFFYPEKSQLIVKKVWEDGFYYIVYDQEDYVKNGMYFVVEKREAERQPVKWHKIELNTVYARMPDTYQEGETLLEATGNPVREMAEVADYEDVTEIYGKRELLDQYYVYYESSFRQHIISIDTSDIDWDKQKTPLDITVRILYSAKSVTTDEEIMPTGDFLRRYSNVSVSPMEWEDQEGFYDYYLEKVTLQYPGADKVYSDYARRSVGTREEPVMVFQRVIKQPVRIEKRIDEGSYGTDHTYQVHKDPFTELMGGYGGAAPALSVGGFGFQCYLKSDLEKTGLLKKKDDGKPDYEEFFEKEKDLASSLAIQWKTGEDWEQDQDLTILYADREEYDEEGKVCYFCISKPLPYGTYVIRELKPAGFPNNNYQTAKPWEVVIPAVPVIDEEGKVHEEQRDTEYFYDAMMGTKEMEQRYHIRFQEENHVIQAHNNDGDFPVYKYGAGKESFSKPYPNHDVAEYYHFGKCEEKGSKASVYYKTYIGRDGKEGKDVTRKDVPSMTGITAAVDRLYAPALVPWSVLAPEEEEMMQPGLENGTFNFISYAREAAENSLYRTKLRFKKKDRVTGRDICHDEAVFQMFAAYRDVKMDEEGNIAGSGEVVFGQDGFPVYNENEPVILTDQNGISTDKIKFFSTGNRGYYETCQPLGAGVYVLKEVKAPSGYVRAKPIAIEVYSDKVSYYRDGNPDDLVSAERLEYDQDAKTDIWQIDVDNEPTEVSIHKVGKRNSVAYVPGAELVLYQGLEVKKTGEHQYGGVEVIRHKDGSVSDILMRLPGENGAAGVTVSLWRYDLKKGETVTDEETGAVYGLNKNGVPVCMVDSETGLAFVYSKDNRCIVCPMEGGERIPAKIWEETGGENSDVEQRELRWVSDEAGHLIERLPKGFYVLEEEKVPYQDGYVQAFDIGIQVKETKVHQKFVMEDGNTDCEISLVDISTGKPVADAGMTLYLADRVQDNSIKGYHLEKRVNEDGELIRYLSWTTSDQPFKKSNIPVGDYILEETEVPYERGYTKPEQMEVTIKDQEGLQVFVMEADHTLLEVQKLDKLTGKALPGSSPATLALYQAEVDEGGNIVSEKDGYPVCSQDKLLLRWKTGRQMDQNVDREEAASILSPVPATLNGIYFTTEEGHTCFEYLPVGAYVLKEEETPDGYASAAPMLISLEDEGNSKKIHVVRMLDAPLSIAVRKQGESSGIRKELSGAMLALYEKKADGDYGKRIASWRTGDEEQNPFFISYLRKGDYILTEEKAPFGWAKAEDICFTVENAAETKEITMTDPSVTGKIEILKTDSSGERGLPGAEFSVKNQQTGEVIRLVTDSSGRAYSGRLPFGSADDNGVTFPYTYEIREERAPEGYQLNSKIHEFQFLYVDDLHPLLDYFYHASDEKNQVKISKKLQKGETYLSGASLQVVEKDTGKVIDQWITTLQPHYINGIPEGEYILVETETPGKGYRKADPVTFTVTGQTDSPLPLTMYDKHTTLLVEKRAADTGKMLPGATLELKSEDGSVEEIWTSGSGAKVFYGLEPGNYILTERQAPAGYEIAEPYSIRLEDTVWEQRFVLTDRRKTSSGGNGGNNSVPPSGGKIEAVKKAGYVTVSYHPGKTGRMGWLEKIKKGVRKWAKLPDTGEKGDRAGILSILGLLMGTVVIAVCRKKKKGNWKRHMMLTIVIGLALAYFAGGMVVRADQTILTDEKVELQSRSKDGQKRDDRNHVRGGLTDKIQNQVEDDVEDGGVDELQSKAPDEAHSGFQDESSKLVREYWQKEDKAPEEWIESEEGIRYRLKEWEKLPEALTGRRKEVSGQIRYEQMEKGSTVPDMTEIKVEDEETGSHFSSLLPLKECEYENESWSNDFQFQMTFHE